MPTTSRRTLLAMGAASAALAATAMPLAQGATTVDLGSFGSPSAPDNADAFDRAIAAAGPGGTVTVPSGNWKISRAIQISSPVTISGASRDSARLVFTGGAYGLSINPGATGTRLAQLGFERTSGATSSFAHIGTDATIDSCEFVDPVMYATDLYAGTLTVRSSRYLGRATSEGTGIQVNGSGSNLTVTDSLFSGLYQGHVAVGAGNITARNNTYLGLWFYGNTGVCQATVAASTPTSVTASGALAKTNFQAYATAVAWENLTSSATLIPSYGNTGTYMLFGVTPQPRTLVRNGDMFGVILEAKGYEARIPYWYDVKTCHPVSAPTGVLTGLVAEKPYIGRVNSVSGNTVNVVSWHAGEKASYQNPPAGARLQLNDRSNYQCFATAGTASFTVDACTVVAAWADQISCIDGRNVRVTNNTLYDGQDVSITLEQVTGGCYAAGNTSYRAGTAAIYIGSGSAAVTENRSFGANFMTDDDISYAAYTIQGANWSSTWVNQATCVGAPKEHYGLYIEGRVGQDNTNSSTQQAPPFATDLFINYNSFTGYPEYDVNIAGTHAYVSRLNTNWAPGTRFHTDAGATRDMLGVS